MTRFLLLLATLLLLAPATALAQAPTTTTGAARDITPRTATLVGTVDPEGQATTYRFDYGTSAAYGLQTAARTAGTGTGAVEVTAAVQDLSPNTTYHYRLVAVNDDGETAGQDATFTTTESRPNPLIPRAFQLRLEANSPTDPVVRAIVNPQGAATTWYAEYGHTTAFGLRTPEQALPAGTADVPVAATLAGLEPNRRVYWRVVATNAAGIRRSGRARFTTQRAPSGVTLVLRPATVRWGRRLIVRGQVQGRGVGGITVALQRAAFPFGTPFADVATKPADAAGGFVFDTGPLLVTTRFQVQTRTPVLAQSVVLTAYSALAVGAGVTLRPGRRPRDRRTATVAGTVRPTVPNGRAALQRLAPDGTWLTIRRARLADLAAYARYRFTVPRLRRAWQYRVTVAARDGGAHVPGTSRVVSVPPRRRVG